MNGLWTDVIPNWLSSIGTIGAVLVALFQRRISVFINRPKIKISCANSSPFVEEIISNKDSSTDEKEMIIRVLVENTGRTTADHCVVNIDCYYEKRSSDDTFCKSIFTPIQIKDYRSVSPSHIAPHLAYYLDVVAIRKSDEMVTSDETKKSHQFYKLFLLGDKSPKKIGKGTFIIPIKISSPRIDTTIGYLKVYWDSDRYNTDSKHFGLKMISNKEFDKLSKTE